MTRPARFVDFRYLGDKRTQIVYDLDLDDTSAGAEVDAVLAAETFLVFGPDTLDEARNRGYRPHWTIREAARRRAADSAS